MTPVLSRLRRGFTLVESMISLIVFAMGLLGVFSLISMAHKTTSRTIAANIAVQAAQGVVESVRMTPYESLKAIASGAESPAGADRVECETTAARSPGYVLHKYAVPAQYSGTTVVPAQMKAVQLPVYTEATPIPAPEKCPMLSGVYYTASVDGSGNVTANVPLEVRVWIVLKPDIGNAPGTAISVAYFYKDPGSANYNSRVLNSYISSALTL